MSSAAMMSFTFDTALVTPEGMTVLVTGGRGNIDGVKEHRVL